MYLLDTNICIALIKANPTVVPIFMAKVVQCYIPTLVLGELYKGVYCSQKIIFSLYWLLLISTALLHWNLA